MTDSNVHNHEKMNEDDKTLLRNARKERKNIKRIEREKQLERSKIQLKMGPTDNRVKLISKDMMANFTNKCNSLHLENSEHNLENTDNNFPTIEQSKFKPSRSSDVYRFSTYIERNNSKKVSTRPVTIDVMEMLTISKICNKSEKNDAVSQYTGNILDASKPLRHKGKYREAPKIKKPTALKSQYISDLNKDATQSKLITYYDNIITDDLNTIVNQFLSRIVTFQENLYQSNPVKGIAKRRYVVGLHETQKLIPFKIKILIIAPDIKNVVENGIMHKTINTLVTLAKENNVPYVFALSRRKLGKITLKFIPTSCVAIINFSGAEEFFQKVLKIIEQTRELHQNANNNQNEAD